MTAERTGADQRVLLLAPTSRDGEATIQILASAGIECVVCRTLNALCAEALTGSAAVIVPEEVVLSNDSDHLASYLQNQPVWSDLPVIVLSHSGAESSAVNKAMATLRNVSLIERPMRISTLLSVVRAALRARQRQYEVRDHLDERRRTEERLSRDAMLLSEVQDSVILTDLNGIVTFWNEGATRLFGFTASEMVGRPLSDRLPEAARAEVQEWIRRISDSGDDGAEFNGEWHDYRKDGTRIWIEAITRRISNTDGMPIGILGVSRDISARKRSEALLQAQNRALELVAAETPLADVLVWLARIVEEQSDNQVFVSIMLMTEDGCHLVVGAAPSIPDVLNSAVNGIQIRRGLGTCCDAAAINGVVITPDIAAAPSWNGLAHLPLAQGFKSAWSMPIRSADGKVLGTFGTYFRDCREPTLYERQLVEGLSRTAALAIERRSADQSLRHNEERFRFLSELGEQTRDLTDPEQVMSTVAQSLGRHLRSSRCAYAEVEENNDHFTIRHDFVADGGASSVGRYQLSLFGARVAADQRAGRTLVVRDVDRELEPHDGADSFNSIGIKAVVCCPLVKGGHLAAMMAVHQATPRNWTREEVQLIEAVVERSWAYIERARVARSLKESEAQFRLIADAMPQIVWVTRPDGYHEYYNRQWYEFLGLNFEQTKGDRWSNALHPDDQEPARLRWQHSLNTGEAYEIEYRFRRHDGEYRWFLARALPVRDADGRILRWYGTCTDIHEQKQFQKQREQLLESERSARTEAEHASRMKDEFLATLSHELRTPLNAILGWAQILSGGTRDAEDLAEGLRTIERNARAQTQIIEDLLDMSRIISGKVRLDVQRVDLASVINSAIETVKPSANAKGIRLHALLDSSAIPVSGDPNRLQQVMWNLLNNAIKFTSKGGRVQVLLERVNSNIEVSVIDSGEGIEPEFLPHVFDRFRQGNASITRRHGGLGLGLAIVKQLVELHGGSICAKSLGKGHGATFVVSLPLVAIYPEAEPDTERRHPQERSGSPVQLGEDLRMLLKGVKVLVVDDEADARGLLRRLLEDCDAIAKTADSADAAFQEVLVDRPDVIVCDIGMPGEDGYSLIRRLRALDAASGGDIPAIALTAYARAEDRVKSVMAGFHMHLAKPVEPAEVIAVIASLAGRASPHGQSHGTLRTADTEVK